MWWEAVDFGGDSGALQQVSDIGAGFGSPSSTGGVTALSSNFCQAVKFERDGDLGRAERASVAGTRARAQPPIRQNGTGSVGKPPWLEESSREWRVADPLAVVIPAKRAPATFAGLAHKSAFTRVFDALWPGSSIPEDCAVSTAAVLIGQHQ